MKVTSVYSLLVLVSLSSVLAYDSQLMLCLVNRERSQYGLNNLGPDARLDNAAYQHSEDMANMQVMTHSGSDGSDPSQRIDEQGFPWESVAENIANGYDNEEECMQQWMESPGHRANILSADSTHFGSGVGYSSDSNPFYTQVFAGDGQQHSFPECGGYAGSDDGYASSGYASGYASGDDSWNYAQPDYNDDSWTSYDDGTYSQDVYDDGDVQYGNVNYDDGNYSFDGTFYDDGSINVSNVNEVYDDGTTWDGDWNDGGDDWSSDDGGDWSSDDGGDWDY